MTSRFWLFFAAALLGVFAPPAAQAQPSTTPEPRALTIAGVAEQPVKLSSGDLKALPRTTVTTESRGKTISHEGVLLADVLRRAGVAAGHGHGSALMTIVVATSRDGYQVAFSMGELDPNLSASQILVADTQDGKSLPDDAGPYRIVAPKDLHGSRGVRALERLEVTSAKH